MDNNPLETSNNGTSLQIIRYSLYKPPCMKLSSSAWFDLRVFYVRISKFLVNDSMPECLTLNHIPSSPDTLLEVNGSRAGIYSNGVSLLLRRDRIDKESEEVTFVCTDSVSFTGNVKFEVLDKEDLILSGVLEKSTGNGFVGEGNHDVKQWCMNCESDISAPSAFLKVKQVLSPEFPAIEVYVAGSFSGTPIILTRSFQVSSKKKNCRKGALDSIPEYETTEPHMANHISGHDLQLTEYRSYNKLENDEEYNSMYWRRTEYMDGEDGELSWFNAGVRVGVGIGLGICLGIGIGVGLLARTYHATTRNFKRRLI
ncbi:uncharacterized protein At1g01500-like [Rutidosis leptorrhynchoides]|uniref:uncharacterized protein At1g01500-like n=1 Tax=Rutidosis leptorrhynchoides TaxID=125765 RepID=UPI003A991F9F